MKAIGEHREGTIIKIHVQPKSSRTELAGFFGDAIKLKVQAPPVEGAANAACIQFLAKLFGVAKSKIALTKGKKSREKEFLLLGISKNIVEKILKDKGLSD